MNGYKNLAEKEIFNLSSAAQDFFHLIYNFVKNENITNFVNVWILEDLIQMNTTITCGLFQLYFLKTYFSQTKTANYKTTKS